MKRQKLIAITLAVLLLAVSLVSCFASAGDGAASGAPSSAPAPTAAPAEDQSADIVVIGGGGAGMTAAIQAVQDGANVAEELGDVLFAAVKAARFAGVDPEDALNAACEKFIRRYGAVEQGARDRGVSVSDLTLEEMTGLWNAAK